MRKEHEQRAAGHIFNIPPHPQTRNVPRHASGDLSRLGMTRVRCRLDDPNLRCLGFVFKQVLGEDWWSTTSSAQLFREPASFLKRHGYSLVDANEYTSGDLILYGVTPESFGFNVLHGGMLTTRQFAVSKFGQGDVYDHPYNLIHQTYGNKAFCARKRGSLNKYYDFLSSHS